VGEGVRGNCSVINFRLQADGFAAIVAWGDLLSLLLFKGRIKLVKHFSKLAENLLCYPRFFWNTSLFIFHKKSKTFFRFNSVTAYPSTLCTEFTFSVFHISHKPCATVYISYDRELNGYFLSWPRGLGRYTQKKFRNACYQVGFCTEDISTLAIQVL